MSDNPMQEDGRLPSLVERLRERNRKEASRRNSAYDHFGMDNTPESVDPDVWQAADTIQSLQSDLAVLREKLDAAVEALHRLTFACGDYGHMTFAEIEREADKFPGDKIEAEIHARKVLARIRGEA